MPELPTGTVTFLFTDIEGSTPLWEQMPAEMQASLAQHHAILRQAIESNAGQVYQVIGDEFQSAFRRADQALQAAIAAQRGLHGAIWGATGPIRVRMGLHTGPAELDPKGDAPYAVSHTLNRAGRVRSAAYGGQVLLSQETKDLVERTLPAGVTLLDLGEHHLKGMQYPEHLYQLRVSGLPVDFPPLPSAMLHPNNLPVQVTSFIGREAEVQAVTRLCKAHRLVTLYGAGGTGKTRLSQEVAARLLPDVPDGVWLVELAPLSDPDTMLQTVAAVLGLQRISEVSYQNLLVNYLRDKRLLLLLDNCEHLLDSCARLADVLLRSCPNLSLLATSREALGIAGEVSYRTPSLAAPDPAGLSPAETAEIESVRLFAERAAAVQPGFRLTDKGLIAAARICHRLDGIPLAIELAAARVNVLSVEQIAARLDDRFRLLTGGSRTALPRHRTLRASIDWSYLLLSEHERLLVQRLSVFSGGWTIEAAERVCGFAGVEPWEILEGLTSLVSKSLVVADLLPGGETRYHMLETIRQFALEKLDDGGQGASTRDAHLEYYLALAEEWGPELRTPRIEERLDQLDLEIDNLRGALTWAAGQGELAGAEKAVRIMYALLYFWLTRALVAEIVEWVDRVLPLLAGSDSHAAGLRAKARLVSGCLFTLFLLDVPRAVDDLRESARLFRAIGDRANLGLALGLMNMAFSILTSKDERVEFTQIAVNREEMEAVRRESQAIATGFENNRDPESQWIAASILLWTAWAIGIYTRPITESELCRNYLERARSIFTRLGDRLGEINTFPPLYLISTFDDRQHIDLSYEMGIQTARRLKSKFSLIHLVLFYGMLALFLRDYRLVIRCYQELCQLRREMSDAWGELWPTRMTGVAYYHLDDFPRACAFLKEGLAMSIRLEDMNGVLSSLVYFAGLGEKSGDVVSAVMLLGFIERQYEGFYKTMDFYDRDEYDRIVELTKSAIGETEYPLLWQQGRELSLEQALAEAEKARNK